MTKLKIKFVRKTQDKKTGKMKLVLAEAPTVIINGAKTIHLPSSTTQKRGFTHEDAEFLLATYPHNYKRKISKGKNK